MVLAPCATSPCKNSGVCKESEDYESFSCVCPTGWQGEACLVPPDWGKNGGWEVRGPGLAVGWSPEMSPSVLNHQLWEAQERKRTLDGLSHLTP